MQEQDLCWFWDLGEFCDSNSLNVACFEKGASLLVQKLQEATKLRLDGRVPRLQSCVASSPKSNPYVVRPNSHVKSAVFNGLVQAKVYREPWLEGMGFP